MGGPNFFSRFILILLIYCGCGLRSSVIGCFADGAGDCGAGPSGFFQVEALFIDEEE